MQFSQPQRTAEREFAEAVRVFFADPCPANLEHYLTASKALEDWQGRPILRRTHLARAVR
jgi:hypothetical protein